MPLIGSVIGPVASLLDKIIPDREAREKAKIELIRMEGTHDLEVIKAQLSAIVAEAGSSDPWTSRARPSFLYVMYVMLLFSLPMGLIAAFRPEVAMDIARGINSYLNGLPDALYALFGTGYLGYTAARQWGKLKGVEG